MCIRDSLNMSRSCTLLMINTAHRDPLRKLSGFQADIGIGTADFASTIPFEHRVNAFGCRIVKLRNIFILLFVRSCKIDFLHVRNFSVAFAKSWGFWAQKWFCGTDIYRQSAKFKTSILGYNRRVNNRKFGNTYIFKVHFVWQKC